MKKEKAFQAEAKGMGKCVAVWEGGNNCVCVCVFVGGDFPRGSVAGKEGRGHLGRTRIRMRKWIYPLGDGETLKF